MTPAEAQRLSALATEHLISCDQYVSHLEEMLTLANERVAVARFRDWSPEAMQPLFKDVQALTYAVSALDHRALPAELLALAERPYAHLEDPPMGDPEQRRGERRQTRRIGPERRAV